MTVKGIMASGRISPCHAFLFILLLISFRPGQCMGQDTLFHAQKVFACRIRYLPTGGEDYAAGNLILKELAKEVLREPWLVRINISGTLGYTIFRDSGNPKLAVAITRLQLTGDTLFRGFGLTRWLIPSRMTIKLRWANRLDTSGYTEQSVNVRVKSPDSLCRALFSAGSFEPQVDTLLVRDIEFSYDSADLKLLMTRINLIHDYYASLVLLDSLDRYTSAILLTEHTILPVNFLKVYETGSVLETIRSRDFDHQLLADGPDPGGFRFHFQEMFRRSRTQVYSFLDELDASGGVPWDGNWKNLSGFMTSRVLSYVRRSFLMDHQQGLIYGDCLEHLFEYNPFPPERGAASLLLTKMFPGAARDTIAVYAGKGIYDSYRLQARLLLDERQYAPAFALLQNGRKFLGADPSFLNIRVDSQLEALAAEGICNSFAGIADVCISNGKYEMADAYLDKAGRYIIRHPGWIGSDSVYRRVFSRLFFIRNSDCDGLLDQKKFSEALDCYESFTQRYSATNLAPVQENLNRKMSVAQAGLGAISARLSIEALRSKNADTALAYYDKAIRLENAAGVNDKTGVKLDSLAPVMAGIRFKQLFREGGEALEKRQFTLSVNKMKEAVALSEQYGLLRTSEFDSVYRRGMKHFLMIRLNSAQKMIWVNQFDSAEAAMRHTESEGLRFGVSNEPDFAESIARYQNKITEQRCRNLKDSVDMRLIRADRCLRLKNYIPAEKHLQEAADLMNSLHCGYNPATVTDTIDVYKPAAMWQRKLNEAHIKAATGDGHGAVTAMLDLEVAWDHDRIGRFGLQKATLFDLTSERGDPNLTRQAVLVFITSDNSSEAIRYLKLCQLQGAQAANITEEQEKLGKLLAKSDFKRDPLKDPIQSAGNYFTLSSWFDLFRSSYLKEWKKLQKEPPSGK